MDQVVPPSVDLKMSKKLQVIRVLLLLPASVRSISVSNVEPSVAVFGNAVHESPSFCVFHTVEFEIV